MLEDNHSWLRSGKEVVIAEMKLGTIIRIIDICPVEEFALDSSQTTATEPAWVKARAVTAPAWVKVGGMIFTPHYPLPGEGALISDAEKWLAGEWRLFAPEDERVVIHRRLKEFSGKVERVKISIELATLSFPDDPARAASYLHVAAKLIAEARELAAPTENAQVDDAQMDPAPEIFVTDVVADTPARQPDDD